MAKFARIDSYEEFSDNPGGLEENWIDGHRVVVLYRPLGGVYGVWYAGARFASFDEEAVHPTLVSFCEADEAYPWK